MNKEEFDKYYSNFDSNNDMIKRKYYHTFRVVEYAKEIAENEKFSKSDIILSEICALLHDIARFRQAKEYNTFIDADSFDHGDEGYKILKEDNYIMNYVNTKEDANYVLKAVKNHNKMKVDSSLKADELKFVNITRDADKIDIMDKQCNEINDNENHFDAYAYEEFKNHKLCSNKHIVNNATEILRQLAFLFDINYKSSFEIIKRIGIIDRKIDVLRKYVVKDEVDEVKAIIDDYIKERID